MQLRHGQRYRFFEAGPELPAAPRNSREQRVAGGLEEQEEFADSRRRIRLVGRDDVTGQAWGAAVYVPGAPNAGYESIGGAPRSPDLNELGGDRARRRTNARTGDEALSDLEKARGGYEHAQGLRELQNRLDRHYGTRRPL